MTSRILSLIVAATAVVQVAVWAAHGRGWLESGQATALHLVAAWATILVVVVIASRAIDALRTELQSRSAQHHATLTEVEQLGTLNEMLTTAGQSKDVGLAFQALARRIGRLIPCDRLGLAVLKDDGQSLQVYYSRVSEPERRRRPRPEVQFSLERSVFGQVIRTCEPVLIDDTAVVGADFQDAGTLASQGFYSLLILPLVSRNRAIGAMTVISRKKNAFEPGHRGVLQPLAEVLAFAFVAQQQYLALDRYRAMEATADSTLAIATELNNSLQIIAGHCAVFATAHPELANEVAEVTRETERISTLLDRMRSATAERLSMDPSTAGAIPSSPEFFGDDALR